MIRSDDELRITRERIDYFLDLLYRIHSTAKPEELPFVSSGYRMEVERMQSEVLNYLTQPQDLALAMI